MSLLTWATNKAYVHHALHLLRKEHDDWARTAARNLPATYWTIAPEIAAADNVIDEAYDIHGQYTFTRWSRINPAHLVTNHGTHSWDIWQRYGPMTTRPQQTSASYHAANAAGHAAQMHAMAQNVDRAAIAELHRLYPHSTRALTNA